MLLCVKGELACAKPLAPSENIPTVLIVTGEISCRQFIQDERANNLALMNLFAVWVWRFLIEHHGFPDAKAGETGSQVDLPDRATVLSFLKHFCEKNPLSDVHGGSLALLKSQRRSGLESTQAAIVGRLRVRKTKTSTRRRGTRNPRVQLPG